MLVLPLNTEKKGTMGDQPGLTETFVCSTIAVLFALPWKALLWRTQIIFITLSKLNVTARVSKLAIKKTG